MAKQAQAIRDRACESENQSNPRYNALSRAVSSLNAAADDMQRLNDGRNVTP